MRALGTATRALGAGLWPRHLELGLHGRVPVASDETKVALEGPSSETRAGLLYRGRRNALLSSPSSEEMQLFKSPADAILVSGLHRYHDARRRRARSRSELMNKEAARSRDFLWVAGHRPRPWRHRVSYWQRQTLARAAGAASSRCRQTHSGLSKGQALCVSLTGHSDTATDTTALKWPWPGAMTMRTGSHELPPGPRCRECGSRGRRGFG